MPPKVKFTKEEIVNAALDVARVKGVGAVTTRDIGAALGVSTRPIFTYFNSMDEVRAEMRRSAEALYRKYIAEGLTAEVPFLGVGMKYIAFAREEPALYRLLFLSPDENGQSGAMAALKTAQTLTRESIQRVYRMDEATADHYFRDMWLVVHSLATLIVSGAQPYTDAEIRATLTEFSLSLCKAFKEIPGFADSSFDRDREFRALIQTDAPQ